MGRDYNNIGLVLNDMDNNKEALDDLNNGLDILLDLEKTTGHHNPLIETIKQRIEDLRGKDT